MSLLKLLNNCSGQPFMTDYRSHKTYTYAELQKATAGLFGFLQSKGVVSGDKIVYFTVNSILFFPLLLAASAHKAALVPLNPKMHPDELEHIVKQLGPKVIFFDTQYASLDDILKRAEHVAVNGNDLLSFEMFATAKAIPAPKDADNKVAIIIYTSGTTTNSKGVALTQKNLYVMANNFTAFYNFREGQRFMSMLPFYHINAPMITGLACICAKSHVFIGDVFGFILAKSIWALVAEHKINVLSITPSIMASLNGIYPEGTSVDISSLEYALVGTAHLKEDLWKAFEAKFKVPCYQGYGLTETTTWSTMTPPDERKRYDSAGLPVGCEVRIDTNIVPGAEVPHGSGEVQIKGDTVMKGYWGNPEATKQVLSGGWIKTGDLGYIDKDGQLVIVGRLKSIIKRKGQLVIPEDVNAIMSWYPDIVECSTFGLPDELLGEKVVTAYVSRDPGKDIESRLHQFAQKNLSAQNRPDVFVAFRRLPKNEVGKVNLRKLKEYASGQTAQELFNIFDKARYRKARTPDKEAVLEIIQSALLNDRPFYLTGYWGVGTRNRADEHDRKVLNNLETMIDEVNQHLGKTVVKIRLILADMHGRSNMIPEQSAFSYFRSIEEECRQRDFATIYLSEIWKDNGLTFEGLTSMVDSEDFKKRWEDFPLKEQFIRQAQRNSEYKDSQKSAQRYHALTIYEREAVAKYLKDSVFFTHNDLEYRDINPMIPTIYIHSIKSGSSEKPWFMGGSNEDNLE